MTYKICQVVFSTNRLDYLIPSMKSHKNLNYYGCDVHKIFIDDYPKTRNNLLITELVKLFGFNEIILHDENLGLSVTWNEVYNLLKKRDYDYIFHLEDDVEILEPVLITDLIELLEKDPTISQVQLSRQAWYYDEEDPSAKHDDLIFKNFRYDKNSVIFSPMASLNSSKILHLPYNEYYNSNLNINEGALGRFLYETLGLNSANVRNFYGKNIIRHIGDWFVGKRVLPNEPNYHLFAHFDPDIKYDSKTGKIYQN